MKIHFGFGEIEIFVVKGKYANFEPFILPNFGPLVWQKFWSFEKDIYTGLKVLFGLHLVWISRVLVQLENFDEFLGAIHFLLLEKYSQINRNFNYVRYN